MVCSSSSLLPYIIANVDNEDMLVLVTAVGSLIICVSTVICDDNMIHSSGNSRIDCCLRQSLSVHSK